MTTYPEVKLLIGGEWRSRPGAPVINPADETVVGQVPHATRADLEDALAAAEKGFEVWRRTAPAKRGEILLAGSRITRERIDEIAYAMTLENGKPLAQARSEIQRGCDIIEWEATEGRRLYGRVIPSEPGMRHTVLRQPIGVVAGFAPWNFPMSSPARKISAALAAGCSLILKASEETPGGAYLLAKALTDGGLPPGVLNLIYGIPAEISDFLIPQPSVRMVTFTGSVPVGKHLTAMAGRHMKPVLMELGGHGPVIVCDDADPVKTGVASALIKSRNSGQVCTAPTRFYVDESIYDKFTKAIAEKSASLVVGNGLDPKTDLGPLANARRIEAMDSFVADARAKGARVVTGGARIGNRGFYYPLTVLADIPDDARVMHEEPFGPLALVNPVKSLDEAIEKSNSLPFGLAAYAFTNNANYAERIASDVEAGNVSINHYVASIAETPFGGVKDSGMGREGGIEGLENYTVVKNVSHMTA